MERYCKYCDTTKNLEEFFKAKVGYLGRAARCKSCDRDFRRTPRGLVKSIWGNQIRLSRTRGHPKPSYTRAELFGWITSRDNFDALLEAWKESDYKHGLSPSVNRIDSSKPYSFDNIQLITWEDNRHLGMLETMATTAKKVTQRTRSGEFVAEYPSIISAAKANGLYTGSIQSCLKGICTHGGGYKWTLT